MAQLTLWYFLPMSPSLKKFLVLGATGLLTALVSSGVLPASVADVISPHLETTIALIVGLVLPEIGRKPSVDNAVVVAVPSGMEPAKVEVKTLNVKERL